MNTTAKLKIEGKIYELRIIIGSEGEKAIDTTKLRDQTGYITLDLRRSFAIGDHPHDIELARNVGATGIYVLTGHGLKHRAELRGDDVVTANIAAAAEWILSRIAGTAPHPTAERHGATRGPP